MLVSPLNCAADVQTAEPCSGTANRVSVPTIVTMRSRKRLTSPKAVSKIVQNASKVP
jgi:hypothetical protein